MPVSLFAYILGFLFGIGLATPSTRLAIVCLLVGASSIIFSFIDSFRREPFLHL